jgi:enoyl-CoA hydratase
VKNNILFSETQNGIGQITLNRPQALNALNLEMICAIDAQLVQWADAEHIKTVVIRSSNNRAFCAGGDIRKLYTRAHQKQTRQEAYTFFQNEYRLNNRIAHYPKPYIALMDGLTMGGGVGISIHGSLRVATENLIFAMPETGIGFFPDIGASYFLSRCPGYTGMYLALTGARLTAADTIELGLADILVPSHKLDSLVDTIAKTNSITTAIAPWNIPATEKAPIHEYRQEIDRCFSADTVEEILTRLNEQNTDWHQETIRTLHQKSPTSLKVTLRQLQKGRQLDLCACLQMEYGLAIQFLENPDFYEGIRAMVIDKDRSPHWSPNTLELVSENDIDNYFLPNPDQAPLF